MRVKTVCKDQRGQEAGQVANEERSKGGGEEMTQGAGLCSGHQPLRFPLRGQKSLGHVMLFQSPTVAPERTRFERLYSPRRGLLHPDMMCLTKAGEEDKSQPLALPGLAQ